MSRKRIGQPISLTITDEMRDWIDSMIPDGGCRTEVIRAILQKAMNTRKKGEK